MPEPLHYRDLGGSRTLVGVEGESPAPLRAHIVAHGAGHVVTRLSPAQLRAAVPCCEDCTRGLCVYSASLLYRVRREQRAGKERRT
jgi:hypothetical protein